MADALPIERRREEYRAHAKAAVREMPADWYCPWNSSVQRIGCADCVAQVVADALSSLAGEEQHRG